MKRVVLYIRVSTDEQVDGFSINEQKERLIAFCKAKGWIIVQIFVDPGWSGSNLERPAMESLISFVEQKACDVVLVYKLDRLSRSQKDTLYLIEDVFLPNKVDFVSVQESFDTGTSFGIAMVGILSVFAQLERQNIKERTMMGRNGRAKKGLWHGGGSDPIGYDYIDGQLVVNEEEAAQVRMVYELYSAGYSLSAIREKMEGFRTKHGDWHHLGTIGAVLDNVLYTGTVHFEDVLASDAHTAIIEPSLHRRVQSIRARHKRLKYGEIESAHLLTGLLHCANCGSRYFAKKNPNGSYTYTCHSRAKVNRKMVKDPGCKNKNWKKEDLERIITEMFLEYAKNPVEIKKAAKDGGSTVPEGEIMGIDSQIEKYMELYKVDQMPVEVIASRINELYNKRSELTAARVTDQVADLKSFRFSEARLILEEIVKNWYSQGLLYRQNMLKTMINRVELDNEVISFEWSF